ncbi:MAG: hypothetical protein HKL95_00270 [Phycisphaerae bacterium]|nr:hypothetical protein [Phycisphaerae bacterium]
MTTIPSDLWRMLGRAEAPPPIPRGLDAFWHKGTGMIRRLIPRRLIYLRKAHAVHRLQGDCHALTESQLQLRLTESAEVFGRHRDTPLDRIHAAALIREAAFRLTGEEPYVVQLAGALALFDGSLVEMATGEGKSLTATIPAIMAGWRRRGCHIITVNDYLAQRDARQFANLYRFCGLTADYIGQQMEAPRRRQAYAADITYCTNKEVCFDFLRDKLALGPAGRGSVALLRDLDSALAGRLVQRGLYFAIVDEADSILIDEAITPLLISGGQVNRDEANCFRQAIVVAEDFQPGRDYTTDAARKTVKLNRGGRTRLMHQRRGLHGLWYSPHRSEELLTQVLVARHFYHPGKQYLIQDSKVVIVDEFTGRLMPDRMWHDGLHQVIEARENVAIQAMRETLARISYQRFFRLYKHLSGMSGTLAEVQSELWHIYQRPLVVLPTHRPCIRGHQGLHVFPTEKSKFDAVVATIAQIHQRKRPILVGTRSVAASEILSARLTELGLSHHVLNAVHHAQEAGIVAAAGRSGQITVATNMAGRGTDIRLDATARCAGGLYVIAADINDAARIDRQLAGRAGRQGDPGDAIHFCALDDILLQTYTPRLARLLARFSGNAPIGPRWLAAWLVSVAQHRASRSSHRHRQTVAHTDHWLEESLSFSGNSG